MTRVLSVLIVGLFLSSAHAAAANYTIERLVFEGDPDPIEGTLNQIIGDMDFDENRRVTFTSYVNDVAGHPIKIFSVKDGVLSVEVSEGDTAAETGGLALKDVGRPRIAAPDVLAYVGLYDYEGDSRSGGFLRVGGVDSALALPGMPAPGGGTIAKVFYVHRATEAPAVALGAFIDVGGPDLVAAHLVHETGGLREVYRDGQAAPVAVGGNFSGVRVHWEPYLHPDGTLTFHSSLSGGSATSGFFKASPTGAVVPVLLAGDPVTTAGGGTFDSFFQFAGGNSNGDVVIAGVVSRPPDIGQAIFVLEGGTQREILFRDDPIAGTNPPLYFRQLGGSGPPALNTDGTTAFVAILDDDTGSISQYALLVDQGGELSVLAKEGDPVPGVPGELFTNFLQVEIANDGAIAFQGYTTTSEGVFLATPAAEVPGMAPMGVVWLIFSLTAFGGLAGSGLFRRV